MLTRFFSSSAMKVSKFIKLTEPGAAGIIQLNRPEALNALNYEMFQNLHEITQKFEGEKDIVIFKGLGQIFSCGGDVKQISTGDLKGIQSGYISSSKTYDNIFNYKKPFVTLMDGVAMGGAAIYAMSPKYRVATERTMFAMPETAIGYFNDAGGSHFLPRLPNNFGVYMGLTGYRVKGYQNKQAGLATHYIESEKLDEVEAKLVNCKTHDEVAGILDSYSSIPSPPETELDTIMPQINKSFGRATVEEIFESLQNDGSDWSKKTLKILSKMSPTSLKVTHRSITLGRNLSIRDCLKLEVHLVTQHAIKSEMKEGVRAMLVEKDFKPNWNPKTIQEVTEEQVAWFFNPSPHDCEFTFDSEIPSKL